MSRAPPPVPTLAAMIEACANNRDVAEFQVRRITQQLEGEPGPGPKRDLLLADLSRYRSDREHWAEYVGYYRAQVGREGGNVVPLVTRPRLEAAPVEEEADRRLPREREPGGDDDGEVPF
jgi:hypothetical protein